MSIKQAIEALEVTIQMLRHELVWHAMTCESGPALGEILHEALAELRLMQLTTEAEITPAPRSAGACDECDPSFGCFNGGAPCSKKIPAGPCGCLKAAAEEFDNMWMRAKSIAEFKARLLSLPCRCGERDNSREGAYEKLWKDFVSIQRGRAQEICAQVEAWDRVGRPSAERYAELQCHADAMASRSLNDEVVAYEAWRDGK